MGSFAPSVNDLREAAQENVEIAQSIVEAVNAPTIDTDSNQVALFSVRLRRLRRMARRLDAMERALLMDATFRDDAAHG